ncbi:MAG: carbohydrate-binding protein, partial [Moraxellaceae bacterium]
STATFRGKPSSSSSSLAGNWTAWLNRDTANGSGDYETRADFGSAVCASPTAIQARVRGTATVYAPGNATPDVLQSFSASAGLACQNSLQNDGICNDYEVRFLCSSTTSSSSTQSSSSTAAFTRTIEAETYTNMSGVQLENTQDPLGGGQNVGWIDANDWMAYSNVNFPSSGVYRVEYRVASLAGGGILDLNLNAGTIPLGRLTIPSTGSWQTWTTISHNVSITSGTYNLGLFAVQGGWNINRIKITKL